MSATYAGLFHGPTYGDFDGPLYGSGLLELVGYYESRQELARELRGEIPSPSRQELSRPLRSER